MGTYYTTWYSLLKGIFFKIPKTLKCLAQKMTNENYNSVLYGTKLQFDVSDDHNNLHIMTTSSYTYVHYFNCIKSLYSSLFYFVMFLFLSSCTTFVMAFATACL
jgi:hypothetical protein